MRILAAVFTVLLLVAWPTSSHAQGPCSLSPVFGLFRQVAGSDVIGECKEPATVGENGDVTQTTTRGLAVYRYGDQVIAFTDGQTTWLYGPDGLQKRAIAEKFAWEQIVAARAAPSLPATPTPEPAPRQPAMPTPVPIEPQSELTPALAAKCSNLGFELMSSSPGVSGEVAVNFGQAVTGMCRDVVEEHGEAGYACFEPAARDMTRAGSRLIPGPGSAESATNAFLARVSMCTGSLTR